MLLHTVTNTKTHINTHTHKNIRTYIITYTHAQLHTHTYIHKHIRMHTNTHTYTHTCNSSPAAGGNNNTKMSTISATAISDCPTPTVSTITVLYPAPSAIIRVQLYSTLK